MTVLLPLDNRLLASGSAAGRASHLSPPPETIMRSPSHSQCYAYTCISMPQHLNSLRTAPAFPPASLTPAKDCSTQAFVPPPRHRCFSFRVYIKVHRLRPSHKTQPTPLLNFPMAAAQHVQIVLDQRTQRALPNTLVEHQGDMSKQATGIFYNSTRNPNAVAYHPYRHTLARVLAMLVNDSSWVSW